MFQASKVFWQAKVNGKSITLSTCIKSTKQHCIMEKQNKMPKEQTFEQAGKVRAEYGSQLIPMLAEQLLTWTHLRRILYLQTYKL